MATAITLAPTITLAMTITLWLLCTLWQLLSLGVPSGGGGSPGHGDSLPPRALETHPARTEDEALRRAAHPSRPRPDETPAPTADELAGDRAAEWRGVSGHSTACAAGAVWTFGGAGPDGNVHGELGRFVPRLMRWVRPQPPPSELKWVAGRSGKAGPTPFKELRPPTLQAPTYYGPAYDGPTYYGPTYYGGHPRSRR